MYANNLQIPCGLSTELIMAIYSKEYIGNYSNDENSGRLYFYFE